MLSSYRQLLQDRLAEARRKKPMFSLRALSKCLKISPASLSQIISGKRPLSKRIALRMAEYFSLSPEQTRQLLMDALDSQTPLPTTLRASRFKQKDFRILKEDEFQFISEWHHYAILALAKISNNRADPKWVARRLNISIHEAAESLQRLQRLGLITFKGKEFKPTENFPTIGGEKPNSAIRKFHRQILHLAEDSIESTSVEQRDLCATIFSFNKKDLEKAKKMLKNFSNRFWKTFESDSLAESEVYTLAVQFFPVAKEKGKS